MLSPIESGLQHRWSETANASLAIEASHYFTRFRLCRQIYLEATRIFFGRDQFDPIRVGVFDSDAWAALVACIEVSGPSSTSCLTNIGITLPMYTLSSRRVEVFYYLGVSCIISLTALTT